VQRSERDEIFQSAITAQQEASNGHLKRKLPG
jgi:hypothetical protein